MPGRSGALDRTWAAVTAAFLLAISTATFPPPVAGQGVRVTEPAVTSAASSASTLPSPASRPTPPTRLIPARAPAPPALSSELAELVRTSRAAERDRPASPGRSSSAVAITLTLGAPTAATAQRALDAIARSGGTLRGTAGTIIEASVPIESLDALAQTPGVRHIDRIRRPHVDALTSVGVAIHGADVWQQSGYKGDGIRIGIIDEGFAGISDRLGTEFPGGVQARCYTSSGSFSSGLGPCEDGGETHGTAIAETIAGMAPNATLYVANPVSWLEQRQTVAWMTSQGVRIVNASFGSSDVFEGPGDGTSPHANSFYSVLDAAVAGGALWVNSAGNSGDLGWTGPWTDMNDNGWLEFSGSDEANSITLTGGETVDFAIRWSDPWGASTNDYDLFLFPAGGSKPVASSTDEQSGTGDPVERITYTALTSGVYEIQVAKHAGSAISRIQLLVQGPDRGLAYRVADGTLTSPADSANPGMVSVGAVNAAAPDTIEAYSSRGPTLDGRTKPDLVAADCADTPAIPAFCGTSQSAPYVAGAAALLLQADPTLGPAQLAAALRNHAVALGTTIPNDEAGWGRLALGPAPAQAPIPAPPPPVPGPPPLGLKALSTPGAALTWRGLATAGTSTVHVVFGERSADGDSVVYRRSTDGGATFDDGTLLSTVGAQAGYAAIASAGSTVHVAWLEGDLGGVGSVGLWYRSSPDGGTTWAAPMPLASVDGRTGNPSVAADGAGHVLVAWTDGQTGRVYVTASADGGVRFSAPRAVGSTTLSPFRSLADLDGLPAVAFGSAGRAYIAWSASTTRVVARRTADAGTTWLPAQTIDAAADGYSRPWLSAYGGGVVLAYSARPRPGRPAFAYVRRSVDGGATWKPRLLASASTTVGAFDPAVTARGLVLRLAYAQCTTSACARARVVYRQSTNGGASWSVPSVLTSTSTYAYPTGVAATARILLLYDAASSSAATTGTAYLRIR